jgi:hypothetical protein
LFDSERSVLQQIHQRWEIGNLRIEAKKDNYVKKKTLEAVKEIIMEIKNSRFEKNEYSQN